METEGDRKIHNEEDQSINEQVKEGARVRSCMLRAWSLAVGMPSIVERGKGEVKDAT
jgi:hypothetical protein